ncbi:ABC transporter permease [[Clostridium] sordellii]|nr:ABC transporter permease [[Clostridium] sordellii] [Paeniclostridium sordellii]CEP86212.1 ABC transporter permease [[Clostridium] sordellii] [Paeniclostridium sordellii]CEP96464.1 ABC transporter permease [[Clostridium] sordellii] [Paeniclostridium sordellii]CEQ00070.1 ABC transporter permease [[Clostridium] sordellii] [Paeniclostridium sordellii]
MGNDLKIVLKYIKSYKSRSLAIMFSIILGTALIVGVGTLSRSAQQADLDRMKRELGTHHVRFKDVNKDQLEVIKKGKDIEDLSITSSYASSDLGEKLPININYASENYLTGTSELLKGRFPKAKNEVVVEEWVLNSMGLEPKLNQELTFKLYKKEKPETFKIVGILRDRYEEKSMGICEMFLALDESNLNKFDAYVEFNEDSDINKNIKDIATNAKLNKQDNIRMNNMLIDSVMKNGRLDNESKVTAIIMSIFAGLVIYSIYTISVYQRIREYGVLKAIGSTNSKVFKLMLYELLILSFISIPCGIVIGMGGAQIFNKLAGNIKFDIKGVVTPFVIPTNVIILSIGCTLLVSFIISILAYMKIRKLAPMDAIRRNLYENKKIKKNNFIISKLIQKIAITKNISIKNIFRNKKGLIMILLSMSIGGILIIKTNYSTLSDEKIIEEGDMKMYRNGDFTLTKNSFDSFNNGITKDQVKEIKNIDGIKDVKTASFLESRMDIPKDKMLDLDYYKQLNKQSSKMDRGYSLIENKEIDGYTMKQRLKGYNDEMINSLNDYVTSGKIDVEKMKNSNTIALYIPHTYNVYENRKDTIIGGGKPVADIKVGDTVKIKIPKGKIDEELYWSMKGGDDYDYDYHEFKVGAIVDYSYADDCMYSYDRGIDVITSSDYLQKITGVDTYNLVYADVKEGADHIAINKELGKIGSKTPGVTTVDLIQEKEATEKMNQKTDMYRYGMILIIFIISAFNIVNNVSYNITSRTSEFGMLRAIGITKEDFEKMILWEGILYGVLSSVIVLIVGVLLQIRIYDKFGYENYGIKFAIAYKEYILIAITNIGIGLLATYFPARKIKESNIVESINIIE